MAVSYETKSAVVIDLFLSEENNTVPAIAEKTGLERQTIHGIINKYLGNLKVEHEEI
ncbi:hypothetical protein [Tenacibaculum sp. SZ-18]|uniref:hypothetical protein n=1 Tax=Tenacibaculum sp. SZ-18 TaxID=754423 RepID=UPI0012FE15DA|nr:hypothetical protein [Tenacibaculum sp. SZ-18]